MLVEFTVRVLTTFLFISCICLLFDTGTISQTKEQTKHCLGMLSYGSEKLNHENDETAFEKIKKEIETSQENALSLCTEKVLLAQQAYNLVSSFYSTGMT